jgi:tetratricopeptide (TPR) repeat protein
MNRRRDVYICLTLAVATLVVFWPAVHHDFINFDDGLYVTDQPLVKRGLTFEGVLWAFSNFDASNWHPVTWMSHMLDCTVFRMFPGGHHLTNVVLHALNAVLLFLLLQRMTGTAWRSAIVAGLFAWHPLHVESVAWVSERKDMLSTLFMILTLWAYVRYAEKPGWIRYGLILVWFALGLMSKAMLVTLPLALLLLDYWPLERLQWRTSKSAEPDTPWQAQPGPRLGPLLAEKLPLFAMATAVGVVTILAQKQSGALQTLQAVPLWSRVANAITVYVAYLGKAFWPVDLAIPYPLPTHLALGEVLLPAGILTAISLAAFLSLRQAQYLAVGWCWYMVTLLPVIGLIQVGAQAMADRYTYLPFIGLSMALVWIAATWSARWRIGQVTVGVTTCAVLLACLGSTREQLLYWRNSVTLFQNTIRVTRNNPGAHNNLGIALSDQGRSAEAIAQYCEALRLKTNFLKARYNLSLEYIHQGQATQAIAQLHETLWLNPSEPPAHNNLGLLLAQQERYSEAISHFTAAVKLRPDYAKAHLNLAEALTKQGRIPEALRHYRVATYLWPDWPEALIAFARILATSPERQFRDGRLAVPLAERACALTDYSRPEFLTTLAAAYAESRRYAEAAATAEEALQLARKSGQASLATQIQNCLKRYKAGKAPEKSCSD